MCHFKGKNIFEKSFNDFHNVFGFLRDKEWWFNARKSFKKSKLESGLNETNKGRNKSKGQKSHYKILKCFTNHETVLYNF